MSHPTRIPPQIPSASRVPRTAVVLIGHGAPATDCPPQLIGELMALEWSAHNGSHAAGGLQGRAAQLDAQIREWPRVESNDPYKVGLERLAQALRPLVPTEFLAVGYNEFCRPSVAEAIEQVLQRGAGRVFVIPSMMTPGGIHSEQDIPRALEAVRAAHPGITIEYLWPFELQQVAALLAAHVSQALAQPPRAGVPVAGPDEHRSR